MDGEGGGLFASGGGLQVRNCTFADNQAVKAGGGAFVAGPSPTVAVDVVFIMDTSTSMNDETAALCDSIQHIVMKLMAQGIVINHTIMGITEEGNGDCVGGTLKDRLGTSVPDPSTCGEDLEPPGINAELHAENWAPATAIAADSYPWTTGSVRLIIPISDEAPCLGGEIATPPESGCDEHDEDAVEHTAYVAQQNNVIVSPILGTESVGEQDTCILDLASWLADETGGTVFLSEQPDLDIAGGLEQIILSAASGDPDASVLFEDCIFVGNRFACDREESEECEPHDTIGAGLANVGFTEVRRSRFTGNGWGTPTEAPYPDSTSGGGLANGGTLCISDSLFDYNASDMCGGAVFNSEGGAIAMRNVTIAYNLVTEHEDGAGVCNHDGAMAVLGNMILWGNSGIGAGDTGWPFYEDQLAGTGAGDVMVSDSIIRGAVSGGGVSGVDPDFVSGGAFLGGDYHLDSSSPAVEAGNNTLASTLDLERKGRIVLAKVDLGALEVSAENEPGACCLPAECEDRDSAEECEYAGGCNVWTLLPGTFVGCRGDADGNGVVNEADRGFITAAIGSLNVEDVCLYDLDGNGIINAADRGQVNANSGQCNALPDWQDGSNCNNSVCPDTRWGTYLGDGTSCTTTTCTLACDHCASSESSMLMGEGSSSFMMELGGSSESASFSISVVPSEAEGYEDHYDVSCTTSLDGIDGYAVYTVATGSGGALADAAAPGSGPFSGSGLIQWVDIAQALGLTVKAPGYADEYHRRHMVTASAAEADCGLLCRIRPAASGTLRLQVYVWKEGFGGSVTTLSADAVVTVP